MKTEDVELIGCMIMQNRKEQVIPNVKNSYPYLDKFVLIDGGSTDGLLEELKELDVDKKINIIDFKWRDNFPESRNQYLINAYKLRDPNKIAWIISQDSDETISKPLLKKLKQLVVFAEQNKYDMLGIRAYDITINRDGSEKSSSLATDWYKGLVYKLYPNVRYVGVNGGTLHETYTRGFNMFRIPSCEDKYGLDGAYVYRHVKTQGDVWGRAQRNLWVNGSGDNLGKLNFAWQELKDLIASILGYMPETYHDYLKYIEKGNVDKRLKLFYIKYGMEGVKDRNFTLYPKSKTEEYFETHTHLNGSGNKGVDYPGSSELREGMKYYYDWLHPEEVFELDENIVRDYPLEQETKELFFKNKK